MNLVIEKARVEEIMKSFHALTGITFVFFDSDGNTILKYPEENNIFCTCMKAGKYTGKKCLECDEQALQSCKETSVLYVYRCHAGLTEACTPLFLKGETVGYLMLGQITDWSDKEALGRWMRQYLEYNCQDGIEKVESEKPRQLERILLEKEGLASEILFCTEETIHAATTIMNACSAFLISEKSIQKKQTAFLNKFNDYLEQHLSEEISVGRICREFGMGRTKLYELCGEVLHSSIGSYIRKYRFERACEMLQEEKSSITEIAESCGYSDPEYFCRLYRQKYSCSARKELKKLQKN